MSPASNAVPDPRAEAWLVEVEGLRRERPEAAWATAQRGFAEAARAASPARRGEMWRLRGHVLRGLRRAREAASCYARAAQWFARAGETRERGRCAIGLVDALMYLGRYAEAVRTAAAGRRLLVRVRDHVSLARLSNNVGNLYHRLDLPDRALEHYRDARRFFRRARDPRSAAMVETNIANCLSLLGRFDEARALYTRAIPSLATHGLPLVSLDARYNLAYLDFLEHRYEAALESMDGVTRTGEAQGYPSIVALAALDRTEILLRLGAYADARESAVEAVNRSEALGLRYERAKADTFAALAEHRLGLRASARDRLGRSLESFHAEGNAVWAGESLVGLGTLWGRDGNPRAAAALFAAACRHFRGAGDVEREACAAALLARTRLGYGDRAGARASLGRVRRLAARRPSPRLVHLALAAEAAWARSAADSRAARRLLERAARESERLAARILDEHWRASFWGEWGWPHLDLAVLELREGRLDQALEALESGRGRALMGSASSASRETPLPKDVRRWAGARFARDRQRVARSAAATADAAPGTIERGAGTLTRALRRLPASTIRARAVRSMLGDGQLLLDYFLHEGALGAIAVRRGGLEGRFPLAREGRVAELAHAILFELRGATFREPAERTWSPALDDALGELASLTLWPALEVGPTALLSILPVGPLSRLPWPALPLPDGTRLAARVPVVTVPGLRLGLIADRAMPRPGGTAPLVVACPAEDLTHVSGEVEAVAACFPGARVLAGDEATVERFRELAPAATWIHFAGHGHYRPDTPYSGALRFRDRWMSAEELMQVGLAARWVTLSACDTARALVRPGEEWFGLARALLLGGAGAVVAAQWDIEDAASAALMSDLYRRLAGGAPLAGALAAAQAHRLGEGAHPLEWAGFVLFGGLGAGKIAAGAPGGRARAPRRASSRH